MGLYGGIQRLGFSIIGGIWGLQGLYRENGKENGSYSSVLGLYGENGSPKPLNPVSARNQKGDLQVWSVANSAAEA